MIDGGAEPQAHLELEPGPLCDTPPPCRCCRGRRVVLFALGGWTSCTWCDGAGVDPVAVVEWRRARLLGPAASLEQRAS